MLRNTLISLTLLVGLAGCAVPEKTNSRADYQTNLDHTIASGTIRTLQLRTGAGSLKIIGEEARRTISIEGIVSSHAESFGEAKRIASEVALDIQAEKTENPIVRITEPRLAPGDQYYSCDLTIRVPHTVQVSLDDSTGNIEIYGLNSGLNLKSESGDVALEAINGGMVITTAGKSKTTIQDSSGHLEVTDGEGDLEISMITGDVKIKDTGGKLVVQNISGNVTAADNPLGVTMRNIEGDVTLIRISPVSSKIQGVSGELSYPAGTQ